MWINIRRRLGKKSDESERKEAKDSVAILISVLALVVTTAGFYLQSVHESSQLSMRLMDFTMEPRADSSPVCRLEIALFNSGNRDTALTSVGLTQGKAVYTATGATGNSKQYFPPGDAPGYVSYPVKGGEIRFVGLTFEGCDFESIKSAIEKDGFDLFSLSTIALNHEGKRFAAEIGFARARLSPTGRLTFSLRMGGSFDLLVHRAIYYGDSGEGSIELWLEGSGESWNLGYIITERFREGRRKRPPW